MYAAKIQKEFKYDRVYGNDESRKVNGQGHTRNQYWRFLEDEVKLSSQMEFGSGLENPGLTGAGGAFFSERVPCFASPEEERRYSRFFSVIIYRRASGHPDWSGVIQVTSGNIHIFTDCQLL